MQRQEVLKCLSEHQHELREFGVASLYLFGSVARNEQNNQSDVDLLVEFNQPVGLLFFLRVRRFLSEVLNTPVDLVTLDALKPQSKKRILKEAIHAT